MSGGSYNYLCHIDDLSDLVSQCFDLGSMAERLEQLSEVDFPGVTAAAERTRSLEAHLMMWEAHVRAQIALLSGVWKAVEWWDSSDSGPDSVVVALAKMLAPDSAAPVRLPFGVEREPYPVGYHGHCPFCGARAGTWHGDGALADAASWASDHCEYCPKRCPELVPRGGGVRCDKVLGHSDLGDILGGHTWGSGPFTRR